MQAVEDVIPYILVYTQAVIAVIAVVFAVSGFDDLFIDLIYLARAVFYRLMRLRHRHPMTLQHLLAMPEQPLAVMIPAWDESDVIGRMLANTISTVDYRNMQLFVGVYPNDIATQREVKRLQHQHPNIHCITCPHPGPTNKADCMNWIYYGIRDFERRNSARFELFVMQDCEDVIHPWCYKLFNAHIPQVDMVQVPVLSLLPRWYDFTAGHYLDEFAQVHYKDMLVREMLDQNIPSAGVGCAFSRHACQTLTNQRDGQLFNIDSLTEDYEFGLAFKRHGLRQRFVRFKIDDPRAPFGAEPLHGTPPFICVREYFPHQVRAAVRQKSRWVVGIAFQGWSRLHWNGNLAHRYFLLRDRKALLTNVINMLGYGIVGVVVSIWLVYLLDPWAHRYPPLIEPGTWLWDVLLLNTAFLFWRLLVRAYCVKRCHGWKHSLLSVPRMVWGNLVNFLATARALWLYLRFQRTGQTIAWDKTAHRYPTTTAYTQDEPQHHVHNAT